MLLEYLIQTFKIFNLNQKDQVIRNDVVGPGSYECSKGANGQEFQWVKPKYKFNSFYKAPSKEHLPSDATARVHTEFYY